MTKQCRTCQKDVDPRTARAGGEVCYDCATKPAPFNTIPDGWREVSEKDFAQSMFFSYHPDRSEHRQFPIEWNGRTTYHSVTLHHYWNQTGAALVNEWWDGKVRFFLFGCDHTMTPAPNNRVVCTTCGFGHVRQDSSD